MGALIPNRMPFLKCLGPCLALLLCLALQAAESNPDDLEFFETRIRPVLAAECYECHNSHTQAKGGLALDFRDGLLKGGDSGPALAPGQPDQSLLVQAIRHASADLRMPKDGAKLPDTVVADFVAWIEKGAPDPRDAPPPAEALSKEVSWETAFRQRQQWWSLQPIKRTHPPAVANTSHPIDRFVRARLQVEHLTQSPPADRSILIRRLTFALTGLPPSPADIDAFVQDHSADAYPRLVDRLLQSPRFGERWARHWMDWLRYADSHGSEGDPRIPESWRYRDYLIRALNDDVPYPQLVLEHLAGDLLPHPRTREEGRLSESALGTAHLRMVFHGFAPTDALDEQVRFTENQVDVVTKAFLGMTVACARCHNHKFDAISQADFYALYGIFASSRPATITLDRPEPRQQLNQSLRELKHGIRTQLAEAWLSAIEGWGRALPDTEPWRKTLEAATNTPAHALHPWARWQTTLPEETPQLWATLQESLRTSRERLAARNSHTYQHYWSLSGPDADAWFMDGPGLAGDPSAPGAFQVLPEGDRILDSILPGGVYSHLLSSRDSAVLHSPRFDVEGGDLWIRVKGQQEARARYVVQNYARGGGLLYPIAKLNQVAWKWQRWNVDYWKGDEVHFEVATARDVPVEVSSRDRSWFGVREAIYALPGQPAPQEEAAEHLALLLEASGIPDSTEALAERYTQVLQVCIQHWHDDQLTDLEAFFLNDVIHLLPTRLDQVPQARPLVERYRRLEATIPVPTRAPGVMEGTVIDQPLFVRGNHRQPTNAVPRHFLSAIDATPYPNSQSGRLHLARDIVRPDNPLAARVLVNRVWHHLFGRGLVATPDNFGRLGDWPSHPDLLDHLASRFLDQGGSLKVLIRFVVLSDTYQQNSTPSAEAAALDPDNRLLSHFPLQRLDAESIRDAILFASGRLDTAMYGPGVDGNSNRRSVYLDVIRNDLDRFLATFDAPEPLTTRGRRNVTNVPGQSLALLNAPFLIDSARQWADSVLANTNLTKSAQRIDALYRQGLGRPAGPGDMRRAETYLKDIETRAEKHRIRLALTRTHLEQLESKRDALTEPVRQKLLAARQSSASSGATLPAPLFHWAFSEGLTDRVAQLPLQPLQEAHIKDGALVVGGQAYVRSHPLPVDLAAKTLEVRVLLDNLTQQGGGALSVQSANGNVFDAVVFGETSPRHWMAGSDFFKRTQDFSGPDESASATDPVHFVITYDDQGNIAGFRNGQPYGTAYRSEGPVTFKAGESVILLGCRHTPPGANKQLAGRILEAKVYDRALRPEEVEAVYHNTHTYITDSELLRNLSETDQSKHEAITHDLIQVREEIAKQERELPGPQGPGRAWQDLAQSIFNLKEFIYIR